MAAAIFSPRPYTAEYTPRQDAAFAFVNIAATVVLPDTNFRTRLSSLAGHAISRRMSWSPATHTAAPKPSLRLTTKHVLARQPPHSFENRLLADAGIPGILRVRYRICVNAESRVIAVVF